MQTEVTREMLHARLAELQQHALENRARWAAEEKLTGPGKQTGVCSAARLASCGVFERYRHATFEGMEEQGVPPGIREQVDMVREYADAIESHLRDGTGLILRGPVGTMKTTLAVAVLQRCLQADHNAMFLTMASLIDAIFSAKAMSGGEWARLEEKLRCIPLLVLDDLGAEWGAGWAMTKIDAIFAERYNRRRSIIITTNLGTDEMKSRYPERIIDRLRSTTRIITFNIPRSLRPDCM